MDGRFPISDEGNLRGEGGEVETLTPRISPVGGPGAPKIFLVVGPEGACLSSEHGVPPVTGRGRGIFERNFAKKLGGKRGTSTANNVYPINFFFAAIFSSIKSLGDQEADFLIFAPGAGSSHPKLDPNF